MHFIGTICKLYFVTEGDQRKVQGELGLAAVTVTHFFFNLYFYFILYFLADL